MSNAKKCSRCKEVKSLEEFHSDKYRKTGKRPDCKSCRLKREKFLYHNYERRKNTNKNSILKKSYGIDLDYYNNLKIMQNNKCAICFDESREVDKKYSKIRDLVVDHNHKTGKIRALLCGPCNRALGGFKEDIKILKNAIKYIKKHEV